MSHADVANIAVVAASQHGVLWTMVGVLAMLAVIVAWQR